MDIEKMNPEVKAKWIEALRSGEYAQTRGVLHNSMGFCCLGVLCDLHMKNAPEPDKWVLRDDAVDGDMTYHDSIALLPHKVKTWAEFPRGNSTTLMSMNDDGTSFNHIADYIEKAM